MKKVMIFAVLLIALAFSVGAEDGVLENGIAYTVTDEGTVSIIGYTGYGTDFDIPEEIDGMPVTAIEATAFFGSSYIKSVTIPASVKSIGKSAFENCAELETVYFDIGCEVIGEMAFRNCEKLTRAYLPQGLISIEAAAFEGCASLSRVKIPRTVETIGVDAFALCERLTVDASENVIAEIYARDYQIPVVSSTSFEDDITKIVLMTVGWGIVVFGADRIVKKIIRKRRAANEQK